MHVQCHERKRVILESLFIAIRRLQGVRRGRAGSLDDPRFKVVAGGPGLLFSGYKIHISTERDGPGFADITHEYLQKPAT